MDNYIYIDGKRFLVKDGKVGDLAIPRTAFCSAIIAERSGKALLNSVPFERIRRITGYLVGSLDRFNLSKRAEVEDRVKHFGIGTSILKKKGWIIKN